MGRPTKEEVLQREQMNDKTVYVQNKNPRNQGFWYTDEAGAQKFCNLIPGNNFILLSVWNAIVLQNKDDFANCYNRKVKLINCDVIENDGVVIPDVDSISPSIAAEFIEDSIEEKALEAIVDISNDVTLKEDAKQKIKKLKKMDKDAEDNKRKRK